MSRISRVRIPSGFGVSVRGLVDLDLVDGRIAAIKPAGATPHGLDADGATLLPGLWDAHTHFSTHALIDQCIDLSITETLDGVLGVVGEAPEDGLTLGFGFRAGAWEQTPTAMLLDAHATHPVALISGDMHAVWCNTAGLSAVDAPAGSSGYLVEDEAFDAIMRLMRKHTSRVDAAVTQAVAAAQARGVVGIVDMEMDWAVGGWQRRAAAAPLGLRVQAACYAATLDRVLDAGWRTGTELAPGLAMGPLKIIADGSMSTKTAHCVERYEHPLPHLPHGKANFSEAELVDLLTRAHSGGLEVAVHAIGDLACRRALDAFEATGARGSIEHAQLVTDDDVYRFARLGVAASVQPSHLIDDEPFIPKIWPHAGPRAFPLRSLVEAGAELRFGSDAPVAPLDPWLGMSSAVHRSFEPGQALNAAEALRASMRTRIAMGEPADLILVTSPPQSLLEGELDDVRVMATITAGKLVYSNGVGSPAP